MLHNIGGWLGRVSALMLASLALSRLGGRHFSGNSLVMRTSEKYAQNFFMSKHHFGCGSEG